MATPPSNGPLAGEKYLDIPSQRLLVLGILAASQAIKIGQFLSSIAEHDDAAIQYLLFKWNIIDALFLWFIPYLRIPRLTFDQRARCAQILLFSLFNWVLFGNYSFTWGRFLPVPIKNILSMFEYDELAISQRRVKIQDVVDYGAHLLGQHTVRLSPISTAKLNPQHLPFCLAMPSVGVFIPIILNNTGSLSLVQYSVSPLADRGPRDYVNITSRELSKMQLAAANLFAGQARLPGSRKEDDDEYDDEDTVEESAQHHPQQQTTVVGNPSRPLLTLEKTQSIAYVRVTRPGVIRLERVLDSTNSDVHISRLVRSETTVVECPTARFEDDGLAKVQCAGAARDVHIHVRGTVPMSLKWHRDVAGKREDFLVEGIEGTAEADGLPLAQDVRIPLTLPLDIAGSHSYSLDSLTDGGGNTVDLLSASVTSTTKRSVTVLGRSSASFWGCGTGTAKTVDLLHGKEGRLTIVLNSLDPADGPWVVTIRFDPERRDKQSRKAISGWMKDFTIPQDRKSINVPVTEPGEYTILRIKGKTCPGEILSPETCLVVEQPMPSAEIGFKSLHECSSDIGVSASLVLHGTPPFVLFYTTKHDKNPVKTLTQTVNSARSEITLKPEMSGSYTYTFTHISDKNYQKIPLSGTPTTTQHVHPLASASFVRTAKEGREVVINCEGRSVDISMDLRGTPPFNAELQLVGPKGSEIRTYSKLKNLRETVTVPILPDVDQYGGSFEVDLVSVGGANGCKRSLDVPGVNVIVKRIKPTVKFYGAGPEGKREITTLENETARLPLRLTGDGPWNIAYRWNPHSANPTSPEVGKPEWVRVTSANENLAVKQEGVYTLLEIHDSHCLGRVIPEASTYTVDWVPKPAGVFDPRAGSVAPSGVIKRPPVCEGVEDHIDIELEGRPPFQVSYSYLGQLRSHERLRDQITFSSIQHNTRLQLKTSDPGVHEYHITHVGDAAYPLPPARVRSPPRRLSGTILEQEVLSRPSAHFKTPGRVSYCMNEPFVPRPGSSDDGTIILSGKPPFKVNFVIKNAVSSEARTETVEISSNEWKVQFPKYIFNTVGPHIVTIHSFEDASLCPPSPVDTGRRSFWIDVAETAAIVPFERRDDFCVGDVLHFQLEGNAPWRVDYRFDGKPISATSKTPKFSRIAEKAGVFEVVGIAHQQASCQTTVSDIRMRIHDLPSARVSHGKNIIEDIREGEQAEILFTLIGEPPFTFTYQRASLDSKKGSHALETHTVSGVMGHEYSVFSALEGTWTVTFISDKYCRYPPATSSLKFDSV